MATLTKERETTRFPISETETSRLCAGATLLLGQYQIERALTAGGFGFTYIARDSLDRHVVIKECFPEGICERQGSNVRPAASGRDRLLKAVQRNFQREALLLAQSVHQNIVPIHQVFQENNTSYIAMEYVEGEDLLSRRTTSAWAPDQTEVIALCMQLLSALSHIHALGITHRDIAPDNLLLDRSDRLVLIDFGAATTSTRTTDTRGIPVAVKEGYSAPEQYHTSQPPCCRQDVYSAGATCLFLVSGQHPPSAPSRQRLIAEGKHDPIETNLSALELTAAWRAILRKALALDPEDRWPSADAMREQLLATIAKQEAPEPPGSHLAEKIADLVAQTNHSIRLAPPRAERLEKLNAPASPPPPKAKYDIFGTPIGDVDAWLAEQDNRAHSPALKRDNTSQSIGTSSAAPSSKPILRRLFPTRAV